MSQTKVLIKEHQKQVNIYYIKIMKYVELLETILGQDKPNGSNALWKRKLDNRYMFKKQNLGIIIMIYCY